MYAKIFETIYDGSLRKDWKALVVFQQLLILSDAKGYVDKTITAISARTGIPEEFIAYGIGELTKVDPESRSREEEGRRLVLICPERNWGWRIVTYEKFRRIVSQDELRSYWAEKKQESRRDQQLDRLNRLKAGLSEMFHRRNGCVWAHNEECCLADICRREDILAEWDELKVFRRQEPRYFPKSVDSLLQNWDRTLDRARAAPDSVEPAPKSIQEKNMEALRRKAELLRKNGT